jgi:hypothetical protein
VVAAKPTLNPIMARFFRADPYIYWGTYLNPATELSKFRNPSTGKPVDLGANGATPTGASPIGFFSGPVATWHQNKGIGGNIFHPADRRTDSLVKQSVIVDGVPLRSQSPQTRSAASPRWRVRGPGPAVPLSVQIRQFQSHRYE